MRCLLALWVCVACAEPPPATPVEGEPTPELVLVTEDPSDAPIADLPGELLARFAEGDVRFELPFRRAQGLGPLYIHRSCESCHEADGRGPGVVTRLALLEGDRGEILPWGDVVRPRATPGATPLLPLHPDRVREEVRLGPALFGRGYLEAIPDETLLAWEREQAEREDGISGRVNRVERASEIELPEWLPALGRFGLKARIASLDEFVADAMLGDMGLTTPLRPVELPNPDGLTDDARPGVDVDREQVELIAGYVRLLAIPARDPGLEGGAALFDAARCSVCHVPAATTRADHPIEALRAIDFAPFTDMLLHDMGDGLADGISEGDATGREWQTPPLMGLRHLRHYLHDGRAASVEEAIDAHASEGSEASDSHGRYAALEPEQRALLVTYVEGL